MPDPETVSRRIRVRSPFGAERQDSAVKDEGVSGYNVSVWKASNFYRMLSTRRLDHASEVVWVARKVRSGPEVSLLRAEFHLTVVVL